MYRYQIYPESTQSTGELRKRLYNECFQFMLTELRWNHIFGFFLVVSIKDMSDNLQNFGNKFRQIYNPAVYN